MTKIPTKSKKSQTSLLTALDFVSPILTTNGTASQTHVVLHQGRCTAYDGIIAMSHPIDESLSSCPHYASLRAALKRSPSLSITVKDNTDLSIRSGKFGATIKSVQYHMMMVTQPDPQVAVITDTLRAGFSLLLANLKDDENNIVTSSLLLQANTMISTDAVFLLEYWHGINMPTLTLSKRLVGILAKLKEPITGFGFGAGSVTFYTQSGAWIKGALREGKWPNMAPILNAPVPALAAPPAGLADAVEAVCPHSPDAALHLCGHVLRSHPLDSGDVGASYDIDVPTGLIFNGPALATTVGLAKMMQWDVAINAHKMMAFVGDNVRGFLMSRSR